MLDYSMIYRNLINYSLCIPLLSLVGTQQLYAAAADALFAGASGSASFFRMYDNREPGLRPTTGEYFSRSKGVYIGASNAFINTLELNQKELTDVDAYAGFTRRYGIFGYNVGLKTYNQTIESSPTLNELFVAGSIGAFTMGLASNVEGRYAQMSIGQESTGYTLRFHLGNTIPFEGEPFYDWRVHASKVIKDVTLNASIVTTIDQAQSKGSETELNIGVSRNFTLF